jgi:hypothetical protein
MTELSTAISMLRAVSRPDRVRVLAALADGPLGPSALAGRTGLDLRIAAKELARLEAVGLVGIERGLATLTLGTAEVIASALDDELPMTRIARRHGIERFFKNGMLASMPVDASGQQAVAAAIAELVPEGRVYTEAEIGEIVSQAYDDVALIRRLLVDWGYMERGASADYRRVQPD